MSAEALALWALLNPHHAVVHQPPIQRIVLSVTGDETPSELSIRGISPDDLPTCAFGGYRISEPLVELVDAAITHVKHMAVLPGDAKADEIVERLIRNRNPAKSRLRRK